MRLLEKFNRVDWPLVLAAFVEIPRWSVAFLAIHEPWVFGVPLAAIITWSMKAGWSRYFERKSALILTLNIASLLVAVVVITPVLYLMTSPPGTAQMNLVGFWIPQVNLSDFTLATVQPVTLLWSFALALTTFIPLIALSAVKADKTREEGETVANEMDMSEMIVPVIGADPGLDDTHVEYVPPIVLNGNGKAKKAPIVMEPVIEGDRSERVAMARELHAQGKSQKEIAAIMNVTDRTVRNWLKME